MESPSGQVVSTMPPNWRVEMNEAMGSLDKAAPCKICCGRNPSLNIRHFHLSTAWYNKQMIRKGDTLPFCFYCDKMHPIDNMTRLKLLASSSTLNGVQFLEGWAWDEEPVHVDTETVCGGKIPTIRKCVERAISSNPLPVDILLVAGLNDILHL